jgi:hypothetical protein
MLTPISHTDRRDAPQRRRPHLSAVSPPSFSSLLPPTSPLDFPSPFPPLAAFSRYSTERSDDAGATDAGGEEVYRGAFLLSLLLLSSHLSTQLVSSSSSFLTLPRPHIMVFIEVTGFLLACSVVGGITADVVRFVRPPFPSA